VGHPRAKKGSHYSSLTKENTPGEKRWRTRKTESNCVGKREVNLNAKRREADIRERLRPTNSGRTRGSKKEESKDGKSPAEKPPTRNASCRGPTLIQLECERKQGKMSTLARQLARKKQKLREFLKEGSGERRIACTGRQGDVKEFSH